MDKTKGILITVEGIDGSGKTTQSLKLFDQLLSLGFDVVHTRVPGGTPFGNKIRDLIMDAEGVYNHDLFSEVLLFAVDRRALINQVIKPAIEAGKIVICDRWSDSSWAYQGDFPAHRDCFLHIEETTNDGVVPHKSVFLDVSADVSIERLKARGVTETNRLDDYGKETKQKIIDSYKTRLAADHRKYMSGRIERARWLTIDANSTVDEVSSSIQALGAYIGERFKHLIKEK